jgi:hypothetical protein
LAEALDEPVRDRPGTRTLAGEFTEIAARIVIWPDVAEVLVQTGDSDALWAAEICVRLVSRAEEFIIETL